MWTKDWMCSCFGVPQDLLQKYEVLVAEKNELTAQFQEGEIGR